MVDKRTDADIIIQGGSIITMDSKRRILENGSVVIKSGRIEAVGAVGQIDSRFRTEKTIHAGNMAVLPGLINTHTHLFQSLYKGLGDDRLLEDWLQGVSFPLAKNLTEEDCYLAALAGCIEAIKSGTTCTFDFMQAHPRQNLSDSVVKALEETGIRGVFGRGMMDMNAPTELMEPTEKALTNAEDTIRRYNGNQNGRIRIWLAPNAAFLVSRECLNGCRQLANKYKTGISIHIEETRGFIEDAERAFGVRELEYLDNIGFLGPDVLAVHCVWIDVRSITLLRDQDVKVSHNPVSNMYLASGVAPIPQMLKAGLTVGLGVDGAASNNNQDLMSVLKFTALLHKVHTLDATILSAEKVLEMATIDGAKSLGLQCEIGSIEKGKRADIILVDLMKPDIVPCHYPVSSIVYSAGGADVDTVIIDGQLVMENRVIKTVDEGALMGKMQMAADSLLERSGLGSLRDRKWPRTAL